MIHKYFGNLDTSTGLWKIDDFEVEDFKVDIWIWDARNGDLSWLEEKIKNIRNLDQKCRKLFLSKYHEMFFGALDSWFDYEKDMMESIFGPLRSANDITADVAWEAIELRRIDLIREGSKLELSIDYKFKDFECNYVVNFRFEGNGDLISCGWES